jgi:ribosomal protein S2
MMIVTSNRERNAILEGVKLGIPIVLLADTNTNPNGILYKVPGNDRSVKAIEKFIYKCTEACLAGLKRELASGMKPTVEHAGSRNDHSHDRHRPRRMVHSHKRARE